MATRKTAQKQPELQAQAPAASARSLIAAPHDATPAISEALTALRYKEAVRVGCLGDTGCGKSRLIRAIVAQYLTLVPGVVFVVDQNTKKAAGWGGQVRRWPADLKAQPLEPNPRIVVFTGDGAGDELPLVAAAELAWQFSAGGRPSLVVLDEMANAVHPQSPGAWKSRECLKIARLFKEGRGQGVSCVWATQFPQEVPLAILNETEDVFAFRLAGSAVTNLRKKGFTTPAAETTLGLLPDTKTPPHQRGAHLRLVRGHQWDGRVYRVRS